MSISYRSNAKKKEVYIRSGYFSNHFLIATPLVDGSCFEKSLIYLCAHTKNGAMGLIVNHLMDGVTCGDIFKQLGLKKLVVTDKPLYFGGPVDTEKGFILHSSDYQTQYTESLNKTLSITSSVDVLKDIAKGKGPKQSLIALGCSTWTAGQLEHEIKEDSWVVAKADPEMVFEDASEDKWQRSAALAGIDFSRYVVGAGNA